MRRTSALRGAWRLVLPALGLASLATGALGCAADSGDEPAAAGVTVDLPEGMRPLAEVRLPHGGSVSFYEPEPGALLVLESGRVDAPRNVAADERRLPADARFERLSGKPAPAALVEAVRRHATLAGAVRSPRAGAEEADSPPARDASEPRGEAVGTQQQALGVSASPASFRASHCEDVGGTNLIWLNGTGDSSVGQKNDKNWVFSAVRSHRGTVRYVFKVRPWYTWRDEASVNIPEGYYESVSYERPYVDFDLKGSVTEANGDLYDFCTHYGTGQIVPGTS